jgi:hypothetical protein
LRQKSSARGLSEGTFASAEAHGSRRTKLVLCWDASASKTLRKFAMRPIYLFSFATKELSKMLSLLG